MSKIDYDVAIRTVGLGGEKYLTLLDSIKNLEPPPKAVYVILPEGGKPPEERLGNEIFVYAQKGMITQRIAVLQYCTAKNILFCDDDICFKADFVKKLHYALATGGYSIAVGELLALLPPRRGLKHFLPIIHAAAVPTLFNKDRFVTILRSAGWSYNRFTPKPGLSLPTQSAAGAMFFANAATFRDIHFEDELWAQHGAFAPAEDQIMFYKAHSSGVRICVVTEAHYDHLDAKTAAVSEPSKAEKCYWSGYNRAVFWHRYILDMETNLFGRVASLIAFGYFITATSIHILLRKIIKPSKAKYDQKQIKGFFDGLRFARTPEYHLLPKVRK